MESRQRSSPLEVCLGVADKLNGMKLGICFLLLAFAGCAHNPLAPSAASRSVAAVTSADEGAALTENEADLCSEYDCANMVAPCSVIYSRANSGPGTQVVRELSMMEEKYSDQMDLLTKAGYCLLPPRELPAETYNKSTCLFVFVKSGNCPYHR